MSCHAAFFPFSCVFMMGVDQQSLFAYQQLTLRCFFFIAHTIRQYQLKLATGRPQLKNARQIKLNSEKGLQDYASLHNVT